MDQSIAGKRKYQFISWLIILLLIFGSMPAQRAYAAAEYGFQGLQDTQNQLKLLEPSDISVVDTATGSGGYFLNRMNEPIDGTTGRIEFAFSMTAGMKNIGSAGNWNFTEKTWIRILHQAKGPRSISILWPRGTIIRERAGPTERSQW